jgi:hypothetical protein
MIITFNIFNNIYAVGTENNPAIAALALGKVTINLYNQDGNKILDVTTGTLNDGGRGILDLKGKEYLPYASVSSNQLKLQPQFNYIHTEAYITLEVIGTDPDHPRMPYKKTFPIYGYDLYFEIILNDISWSDYPYNWAAIYRKPLTGIINIVKTHSSASYNTQYLVDGVVVVNGEVGQMNNTLARKFKVHSDSAQSMTTGCSSNPSVPNPDNKPLDTWNNAVPNGAISIGDAKWLPALQIRVDSLTLEAIQNIPYDVYIDSDYTGVTRLPVDGVDMPAYYKLGNRLKLFNARDVEVVGSEVCAMLTVPLLASDNSESTKVATVNFDQIGDFKVKSEVYVLGEEAPLVTPPDGGSGLAPGEQYLVAARRVFWTGMWASLGTPISHSPIVYDGGKLEKAVAPMDFLAFYRALVKELIIGDGIFGHSYVPVNPLLTIQLKSLVKVRNIIHVVKDSATGYTIKNYSSCKLSMDIDIFRVDRYVTKYGHIAIQPNSNYNINIDEDGVYRLVFKDCNGLTFYYYLINIAQLEDYIIKGAMRFRGEQPCTDCNNYDFCNILMLMQTYYMLLHRIPDYVELDTVFAMEEYEELTEDYIAIYSILQNIKPYLPK